MPRKKTLFLMMLIGLLIITLGFAFVKMNHRITTLEQTALTKDYFLTHPEILLEFSQALKEKKETQKQALSIKKALPELKGILANNNHPVIGNPDGKITIIEFFDYQCGYCKQFHHSLQQVINQDKNIRLMLIEAPVFHERSPESAYSASIGLALYKKHGATIYEKYHSALMSIKQPLTANIIEKTVANVGVNIEELDLSQDPIANVNLMHRAGGMGTPYLLLTYTNNPIGKHLHVVDEANPNKLITAINKLEQGL